MTVQIRVSYPTSKAGEFREVYRNQVTCSDDCVFEFAKLVDGLNLLYNRRDKIITLNIM